MDIRPHYLGSDHISEDALRNAGSKPLQRPEPLVRVDALAYVIFQRPDMDTQRRFLEDFGMRVVQADSDAIYLRGNGISPWFYCVQRGPKPRYIGAGYEVTDEADLQTLAAHHGVEIEDLDTPGGGKRVRLTDPSGFVADFVHGREPAERIPTRETAFSPNTPLHKDRINSGVRTIAEPCPLEKLGHLVMAVPDFERSAQWYMQNLGLIATDVNCVPDGTPVLAFMRCDRGDKPADHHSVVIVQNIGPGLLHTAYETTDLDSVGQGAQQLKAGGWDHHWGIGRHILGSQIFDYWRDPCGVEMEHYADGDVFTADEPTRYHVMDQGGIYAWGPDVPPPPQPGPLTLLKLVVTGKLRKLPPSLLQLRKALGPPPRPWLK